MNKKKELQEQMNKLEKEMNALKEKIDSIDKDEIIVPFEFEYCRGNGQRIGLPFGTCQVLTYRSDVRYGVEKNGVDDNIPCKLGPEVSREELKTGYWYYVTDEDNPNTYLSEKDHYKLMLENSRYVYVNDNEYVRPSSWPWNHYYPIIPIEVEA